ncbi:hypothetical protein DYU11_11585 [Fibrisoma montanum]|uniref:Uncharacterized protein n=1 Tax=Fibrisoma montanum TaxID=2305895 RepID=A0A418MBB2_9BACT|nr:hypothetical protein [Fibrisoma montanum]RIV23616.1 hypothetical protein DYU11_11585 [Fibrisoma montanum]
MNENNAKKRIGKIEQLQADLDARLAALSRNLYTDLMASADTILASPKTLSRILNRFEQANHVPVLEQFGADLLTITDLNVGYFSDAVGETMGGTPVNEALFSRVKKTVQQSIADRFGLTPTGEIVPNGLFDLFTRDTTVRRQVQQFAYAQRAANVGLERFKKNLRAFITPPGQKTLWNRHYDTVAYDTYQQADRLAQQTFAEGLNMRAFLYLGGKLDSSRPFCLARDGKVFLRPEIEKFGTPQDAYGGYLDKARGKFQGKPSAGYAPFEMAGGYRCRHHYSAISDREAMRRRPDLVKGKDGALRVQPAAPNVPTALTDYQTEYGVSINADVFRPLTHPVPMERNSRGYYYSPSTKPDAPNDFVNVNTGDARAKNSQWFAQGVIYHEYGHATDWHHRLRDRTDVKVLMDKYRSKLAAKQDKGYARLNAAAATRTRQAFSGPVDHDAVEQTLAMADTLQALNPAYGFGHSVTYYKTPGFAEAEFLAHAWENYFLENPVFEAEWPDLYRDTRKLVKKLLSELGGN